MAIDFQCPNCARQYSVADSMAGQRAICAKCKQVLTTPMHSVAPITQPVVPVVASKIQVARTCGRQFTCSCSSIGRPATCDRCGTKFTIEPAASAAPEPSYAASSFDDLLSDCVALAATSKALPRQQSYEPEPISPPPRKRKSYAAYIFWRSIPSLITGSLTVLLLTGLCMLMHGSGRATNWDFGWILVRMSLMLNLPALFCNGVLGRPDMANGIWLAILPFIALGAFCMLIGINDPPMKKPPPPINASTLSEDMRNLPPVRKPPLPDWRTNP